ncbi:MAG TPA: hypothetical protein VF438_00385 [Candidatus Paceibacterota bacterium]
MAEKKDNKVKTQQFRHVIIAFIAMSLAFVGYMLYTNHDMGFETNGGTSAGSPRSYTTPPPTPEQQLQAAMPATVCDVISINDTTVNGILVPKGLSTRFKPTGARALSYEYYIDGRYVCTYKANGTVVNRQGQPVAKFADTDKEHSEGWMLEPGQGVRQNGLAFVVYAGVAPSESVWYQAALVANGSGR